MTRLLDFLYGCAVCIAAVVLIWVTVFMAGG